MLLHPHSAFRLFMRQRIGLYSVDVSLGRIRELRRQILAMVNNIILGTSQPRSWQQMASYEMLVQPLEFDFRGILRKWVKFPGLATANIPFSSAPKLIGCGQIQNTKYKIRFYLQMHQWGQDLL